MIVKSPQLSFDFGTNQLAANDPIYSTALYKRGKRDYTFYGTLASKRQWRLVMERARWRCEACELHDGKLVIDHIIPIAAGGDQFCLANQRVLCQQCHRLKTSTDALRYGWQYGSR